MFLGIALAAALNVMPQAARPEPQSVLWQDRRSGPPLVQVLRGTETGALEVRCDPDHVYQRVVLVVPSESGEDTVRVELHEVHESRLKRPASAIGLRDLDSIWLFYRVEFQYVRRSGQTLTIYSGPAGYLVRVVTHHAHEKTNRGDAP